MTKITTSLLAATDPDTDGIGFATSPIHSTAVISESLDGSSCEYGYLPDDGRLVRMAPGIPRAAIYIRFPDVFNDA